MDVYRSIFATLIIGVSGCCSQPVPATIDIPPRPVLIPLTQEQWEQIPADVGDIIDINTLELKKYAKRLEERIRIHNETVQ